MEALAQNPLFVPLLVTVVIIALFPLVAGYIVLVERKILADIQVRLGPMRVGPHGILQPIADALKLLLKEDTIPADADRAIFWFAPVVSTFTALTGMAMLPFGDRIAVADVNVGVLVIMASSAVGILGIILGGWSSNSHYPLLGALRSAAQLVSYEVALSFAILTALLAAGTLSLQGIVKAQFDRGIFFAFDNFGLMLLAFFVFLVASTAEANRTPFDLPEAESELVAGFHTEYSGFRWALYMLSEYANLFVMCAMNVTLFWGGWLRPFPNVGWLELPMNSLFPALLFAGSGVASFRLIPRLKDPVQRKVLAVLAGLLVLLAAPFLVPAVANALSGLFWFLFKVFTLIYVLIWFRGTFPRLRYDQLMDLGWKRLIPLGLISLALNAVVGIARSGF